MKIALLHGFNVSDGGEYLRRWKECFRRAGHDAYILDYGWVGPLRVRVENMEVVERLAERQPDVILGHSNGSAIAWQYLQQGHKCDSVICVQPALNTRTAWPYRVRRIVTLYNPGDRAVVWGRRWRYLNPVSWIKPHYWGAAGNRGFRRSDGRFVQFDTSIDPVHPYEGHSISRLKDAAVKYWCAKTIKAIDA